MQPFCVAVDWGTTSFRLWLLDFDGNPVAARRSDEGLRSVQADKFGEVLESHLLALGVSASLPVVVCGMAGSRQGWLEASYCDVPTPLSSLSAFAVKVPSSARDVRIVPGIAQRIREKPDVMRGEETQLLGALDVHPGHLFACLPGTHSKWVHIHDGAVQGFTTFMTGELYAAIGGHTILQSSAAISEFSAEAFSEAVQSVLAHPVTITSQLFAIRAGELLGYQDRQSAHSTLSGLLIGQEIAAAIQTGMTRDPLFLIASGKLAERYELAFTIAGISATKRDAEESVVAGLFQIAHQLFGAPARRLTA